MLEKLIVLVEEPSMERALEQLLPKMLTQADFQIIRFQCKDDLLKHLPARLRGYSNWLPATWVVLVLVDRDDDDCRVLKQVMEKVAADSGLLSKTRAGHGKAFQVVNRIAIEELEAWYFGDWPAVRVAYPRVSATLPSKQGFRDPDAVLGGTWEALERVLKQAGYYKTGLRKMECAKAVALNMNPLTNSSKSFQAFFQAVADATAWV